MTLTCTGTYTRTPPGYMGRLAGWPEAVTEGKSLEECRERIEDALREMVAAYRQQLHTGLRPATKQENRGRLHAGGRGLENRGQLPTGLPPATKQENRDWL